MCALAMDAEMTTRIHSCSFSRGDLTWVPLAIPFSPWFACSPSQTIAVETAAGDWLDKRCSCWELHVWTPGLFIFVGKYTDESRGTEDLLCAFSLVARAWSIKYLRSKVWINLLRAKSFLAVYLGARGYARTCLLSGSAWFFAHRKLWDDFYVSGIGCI